MLKIETLKLRHFMCCTSADLEFTDAGIIVLNGENGSGKSSALDAIAICLCEHKRADRYNDFVQKGFNEATIEMKCNLNGEELYFNIKMHYSKGAALERDITYKNQHYINSEAGPLLQQLDLPFYSTIIFSMQGDADVASMSPTARAIFLQKLLQFDFDKQSNFLKEKIEEYEASKTYNNSQIEFIENDLKNKVLRTEEALPFTKEEYNEKYKKSLMLARQIGVKSLLYKDKDELIEKQRKLSASISQKDQELALYKQWEDSIKDIKESYEITKKSLESFNEKNNLAQYDEKVLEINNKLQEIPSLWKEATDSRDKLFQDLADYKNKKNNLLDKDKLLKAGKCPHCGQSTNFLKEEHIEEALLEIDNNIDKCQNDIKDNDEKVLKYKTQTSQLQKEVSQILNEKSKKSAEFKGLKTLMSSQEAQLEKASNNIPILSQWPESLTSDLEEINSKILELSQQIDNAKNLEEELSKITADMSKYTEIEKKNNWIIDENKKLESMIESSKSKVIELKQNNIELTNTQKDYAEARKIIDTDLPNFLIVKTCGRLEQEMNNFIQVVFPTMQVRLFQNKKGVEFFYTRDEKANSKVKNELINTKMASGFEKSLLSIAFKVALCRAYNLSFTVLDEIDAFATDSSSEKIFQSLIESKAFDQIFIITHKPSTREVIHDIAQDSIFYHVEKGKFTLEDR